MLNGGSTVIEAAIGFLANRMRDQLALLETFSLKPEVFQLPLCVCAQTDSAVSGTLVNYLNPWSF